MARDRQPGNGAFSPGDHGELSTMTMMQKVFNGALVVGLCWLAYYMHGQDAAHYVDSFGYKEAPEFLQEQTQQPEKINPLKHVEDTIEQNDNNFDGIINNTPTVDELEAKVKAGEQISLVDLAEAIKADKERGKEKPSIRAQLKADKERTGKRRT